MGMVEVVLATNDVGGGGGVGRGDRGGGVGRGFAGFGCGDGEAGVDHATAEVDDW